MTDDYIDPQVFDLYDKYCHSQMTRREFLNRSSALIATQDAYKKALEANNKNFVMYTYEGTRHGFHNNSTPRYNEAQAKLAWERTVSFFKQHLS